MTYDLQPSATGGPGPLTISRRSALRGGLALLAVPLLAACSQSTTTSPTAAPTTAAAAPTAAATAAPTSAATAAPTTAATVGPTTAAASPTVAATTAPAAAATTAPATTPATTPAAQSTVAVAKVGGAVSVLATWGGVEQQSFEAMVKPWADQSGAKLNYVGTRDLNAVLTTRVKAGNPPDLVDLPSPGQMAQFAKAGNLVDLSGILDMTTMKQQYAQSWLSLASVAGKQYGIFIKAALKGSIWYDPKVFKAANYSTPQTWTDLIALSNQIVSQGKTPWSLGLANGAASGWPGADWIADIVLRQAGPQAYDQWWQGTLAWASPEITKAWQTWGTIVANPKMVYGGPSYILSTEFSKAADPLFTNPPHAYLHDQGSFITSFIEQDNPGLQPVTDFNFFMFPDIDPSYTGAITGSGDIMVMFKQSAQSSSLMQWLTTPGAQEVWVKRGGALSPNQQVPMSAYPDPISQESAKTLTSAKIVRFGADDLMPTAMENAFWKATLSYVQSPTQLSSILAHLDSVRATAYKS